MGANLTGNGMAPGRVEVGADPIATMGRVTAETSLQAVRLAVIIVAIFRQPGRYRLTLAEHFHSQQLGVARALALDRLLSHQHLELVASLQILGEIQAPLEQVGNLLDVVGRDPRVAGADVEAAIDDAVITLLLPLNLFIEHVGAVSVIGSLQHQGLLDIQTDLQLLQYVVLIDQQLDGLTGLEAGQIILGIRIQHLVEGGGGEAEIVEDGGQVLAVAYPVILPLGCGIGRNVIFRRRGFHQFVIRDVVKIRIVFVGCRASGGNGQLQTQWPLKDVTWSRQYGYR
ncbi:hypothetical protein D3C80_1051420 [compost metagenome]